MAHFPYRPLLVSLFFSFFSFFNFFMSQPTLMAQNPAELETARMIAAAQKIAKDDSGFGVLHYTINIEPTLEKPYLKGEVVGDFISISDNLTTVTLNLHTQLKVAKVEGSASFSQEKNNTLVIVLPKAKRFGESFRLTIAYEGEPPYAMNATIKKGLRWEKHNEGKDPVIANLSTPFLAHLWFPCKDGPSGKIQNGVFVNITVPDVKINDVEVVGISNGLLREVVKKDGKSTYKWEHNYPIVPYYVMCAVSNYQKLQQDYTDPYGNKFPLEYYVFKEHVADAKNGTAEMPKVMDFFSTVFGEYPYAKEKYGMTQLGFYSGIENQTNAIVNNMGPAKFYTSVHELAHMWFADAITCATWQHGWLNEGFASYSEALWDENAFGKKKYIQNMLESSFYDGGTLLLPPTDDPFKVFVGSIYNKGQWTVHMLRGVMGDDAFFKALKEYAQDSRFKYSFATTENLQEICEKHHKKSLDWFFKQWVYGEFFPSYTVSYTQLKKGKPVDFRIEQTKRTTMPALFAMPMQVLMTFEDGTTKLEKIEQNQASQTYTFQVDKDKVLKKLTIDPDEWVLKQVPLETFIRGTKKVFEVKSIKTAPDNAVLNVQILSPRKQDLTATVYDIMGNSVFTQQFTDVHELFDGRITPTKAFSAGVYKLEVTGKDVSITKPFSVTRIK